MKLKPVNNHILIEPVAREAFMASHTETFQEIGVVIAVPDEFTGIKIGDKVFFDSWLAAKYPAENTDWYYWLVKWEDIRAYVPLSE